MKGLVADLRFTKTFACDKPHYPFELPKGWEWTTLGEVISIKSGNAIKVRNNKNGSFPIYGGNGISGYSDEYNIDKPTIVIGRVGFYCGSIHYVKSKAWVTDNAFITSTYGNVYDIDFLYYLLTYCNLRQYSNSTAQPVISGKTIYPVHVPVPPIKEQRKIVEKIEFWLLCISQLEFSQSKVKSTIKQAKSKILDLAIHGKLVPQDPNDEPASELLKRINPKAEITCDNHQYGKLPKGWCLCHIPDVANTLLGKTLDRSKNTGTPKDYLCAINVLWGKFDFTTHKQFLLEKNEYERYAVMKGDLMVCEGGDVGRCAIWEDDSKEIYYQNALHRIRCKEGVFNYYILYLLWHYKLNGTIDYLCKGVTIKHFTQTVMNKLDILLPPFEEQKRIVTKIEELFAQLDKIESSLQA